MSVVTAKVATFQGVGVSDVTLKPPGGELLGGGIFDGMFLNNADEFMVRQTKKGWFQECCGCEANSEFKFEMGGQEQSRIEEQSSCCMRFICRSNRPWITKMSKSTNIEDAAFLTFIRPFRCHMSNCKCCCYQEVEARVGGETGTSLGMVQEQCWYCVPTFKTLNEQGADEYVIHQPTCCGGCMINPCHQGCCNCRIPFMIMKSNSDEIPCSKGTPIPSEPDKAPNAQITKVWRGMSTEILTDADSFELKCPDGADASAKARLIGATLLLNQLFFEGGDN